MTNTPVTEQVREANVVPGETEPHGNQLCLTALFKCPSQNAETAENGRAQSPGDRLTAAMEQLDTVLMRPSHIALKQLQDLAERLENYANKLLKAINPQEKDLSRSTDNQNKQRCPFKAAADAVGFKYKGAGGSDAGDAGRENADESERTERSGLDNMQNSRR